MEIRPVKPSLKFLFQATVNIGPANHVSKLSSGERRYIPIIGGSFKGEKLSGEVLSGGADWQLVRPDGSALLHARYTLRTKDDALIYVENKGIRWGKPKVLTQLARGDTVDPSKYYFRTTPKFETGARQYAWLNNIISVCSGMRLVNVVIVDFYLVL
jgi:hypothetical protein